MKTVYNFNALGQLSELTHFKQDEILDKFVYGYDVMGNKSSITKQRQGLEVDHGAYTYSYDPLNRLTEVIKDGNPLRSYEYDNFGNRLSMVENGVETHYAYNSLNQLISSTDGNSYLYDQRGNLTQIMKNGSIINEYEFNPMNRLEKTINHETHLFSIYQYNGLSRRVGCQIGDLDLNPIKQVDDVLDLTKTYHNLLQRNENGVINSYTYDFGLLSNDGNPYLLDDLGSPMRFGDEAYAYDEFGNNLCEHTSNQPFSYTGYQHDSIAGNYFAQARQYDPSVGCFTAQDTHWNPDNMIYGDKQTYSEVPDPLRGLAPDPLVIGQSSNLYSYTMNNPVNNVDLNGEALFTVSAGVIWGTVKLVGVAFAPTVKAIGTAGTIGSGVAVAGRGISDLVTSAVNQEWNLSSWQTYVGDAAGGFVAGASPGEILFNSVWDGTTGSITAGLLSFIPLPTINGRGINSGRGSMESSFYGMLTKIRRYNHTARGKTIKNGVISGLFGGFSESILAGISGTDIMESITSIDDKTLQDISREWIFNILGNSNPMEFCNTCK